MQLVGADKYLPEKVPELEKYVDQQVATGEYDLDANLALLRHYQFQQSARTDIVAKILLKALMQLPGTDFRTCLLVLTDKTQAEAAIAQLVAVASALETARFADFWSLAASSKDIVALVPGFDAAARRYVLHVLGSTFQRVNKRLLATALKLEGQALEAAIAQHVKESGWQVAGDVVVLPRNELNSPVVVKRTQESIRFEQIAPVLRTAAIGA